MQKDHLNEILERYGCGPIQFSGTSDALYERHLTFDHVVGVKKADLRQQFEAAAHSIRDLMSQRWLRRKIRMPRRIPSGSITCRWSFSSAGLRQ